MTPTQPVSKISLLRAAWTAGDRPGALKIAARFPDLGEHADPIRRAQDAAMRPGMYRQMKRDPEALINAGYAALAARYGLTL